MAAVALLERGCALGTSLNGLDEGKSCCFSNFCGPSSDVWALTALRSMLIRRLLTVLAFKAGGGQSDKAGPKERKEAT